MYHRIEIALLVGLLAWCVSGPGGWAADPQAESASEADPAHPRGWIKEGPLPEGFPPPGEIGQVVEKDYPLCRTFSAEGNNAFMKCFGYLSKHKHEMTAPVILDQDPDETGAKTRRFGDVSFMDVGRMHFVLEKPSLDEPKREGSVVVGDIPKLRVLSIALQGAMSPAKLNEAEDKLQAEIEQRRDLVAAGPARVLGYNGPSVPTRKKFWEVQIPIAQRDGDARK